jgi:hypothetical protein
LLVKGFDRYDLVAFKSSSTTFSDLLIYVLQIKAGVKRGSALREMLLRSFPDRMERIWYQSVLSEIYQLGCFLIPRLRNDLAYSYPERNVTLPHHQHNIYHFPATSGILAGVTFTVR